MKSLSIAPALVLLAFASLPVAADMLWPRLAEFKATSHRAATEADVTAGAAVFVLKDAGKPIGQPIDIVLPQYAIHVDSKTGEKLYCIVIQAEEARGQRMIGAYILPRREPYAGFFAEFRLLGITPPKHQ